MTHGACRDERVIPSLGLLCNGVWNMARSELSNTKIAAVLVGFPLGSTLLSLLLLKRDVFAWSGAEFFTVFWALITLWYATQIWLLSRVLKSSGWTWADIGFGLSRRGTAWFVGGFLLFAFALFGLIELAMGGAALDPAKVQALSDLSNLTPKTSTQRFIFVFMALAAGLCEELVYRGFAIRALEGRGMNRWLAVLVASIPFVFQHGLKSIDQFWWFFIWGLVFGVMFVAIKRLYANIVIHWLVILSAMLAVLQVLQS